MISNEVRGVKYECLSAGYFPYGANYTSESILIIIIGLPLFIRLLDPDHRVCALPGATPGMTFVAGKDYTDAYMGFDIDNMGLYIMALLLIWLLFCVLNALAVEFISFQKGT